MPKHLFAILAVAMAGTLCSFSPPAAAAEFPSASIIQQADNIIQAANIVAVQATGGDADSVKKIIAYTKWIKKLLSSGAALDAKSISQLLRVSRAIEKQASSFASRAGAEAADIVRNSRNISDQVNKYKADMEAKEKLAEEQKKELELLEEEKRKAAERFAEERKRAEEKLAAEQAAAKEKAEKELQNLKVEDPKRLIPVIDPVIFRLTDPIVKYTPRIAALQKPLLATLKGITCPPPPPEPGPGEPPIVHPTLHEICESLKAAAIARAVDIETQNTIVEQIVTGEREIPELQPVSRRTIEYMEAEEAKATSGPGYYTDSHLRKMRDAIHGKRDELHNTVAAIITRHENTIISDCNGIDGILKTMVKYGFVSQGFADAVRNYYTDPIRKEAGYIITIAQKQIPVFQKPLDELEELMRGPAAPSAK